MEAHISMIMKAYNLKKLEIVFQCGDTLIYFELVFDS
jgi:hypothetical protein